MTKREALIISAYLDCQLTDLNSYQKFCDELLGQNIPVKEFDEEIKDKLKDKCEAEFFAIINNLT